jgi:uncharacterized protein (TIGR02145 family)
MKNLLITMIVVAILLLSNSCKKSQETTSVTDIEGNVYKIVTIGTQVWMQENLKTSKLKDGTSIPTVSDNTQWNTLPTPGLCFLDNDAMNKDIYGALYNRFTVNTGQICPDGWHVPNKDEVTTLITYLGGAASATVKLIESGSVHWNKFDNLSTNESGFTALPGRYRYSDGFTGVPESATWWTSTVKDNLSNVSWSVVTGAAVGFPSDGSSIKGYSIRCLKN